MKTIQITVNGRVQGVYFRAFTQKQAIKQDVIGFVRNKADGTVEIIASASQDKLDQFINWCHKGPLMAKVSQVIVKEYASNEHFTQFEVR